MIFSSVLFLFSFLPLVLGLYYLAPNKMKNFVLLIVSLLFYTWGEDKIVVVMLLSAMIDFSCGLLIERGNRKLGLALLLYHRLLTSTEANKTSL